MKRFAALGAVFAFALTSCGAFIQIAGRPSSASLSPAVVGADFELVQWDSGGTLAIARVENTSTSAYLTDFRVTATGGGVFDWVANGNTLFTITETELASNDSVSSVVATLDFGTPGLAVNATDSSDSGDWDGTITGFDVRATFSNNCYVDGALSSGTGPEGSTALWSVALSDQVAGCNVAGGGGGPDPGDPGDGEGDELVAASTNYFVDPTHGSCNNGGAGTSPSTPWCSAAGVEAATFSANDRVWFLAGTILTGSAARVINSTIIGTVSGSTCSARAIIGSYYMDGATARRGLNSGARPILQGTAGWWDHEGTALSGMTQGAKYPASDADAMLGVDDGRWDCVRVENLHLKHSGGRAITLDEPTGVQIVNLYIDGTWTTGVHCESCINPEYRNNFVTGTSRMADVGAYGYYAASLTFNGVTGGTIANNVVWDNFGEGIDTICDSHSSWKVSEDVLVEDNFILDAGSTLLYLSGVKNSIFRRNVVARTSRSNYWRNAGANWRGDTIAPSDECYLAGSPTAGDTNNLVIYSNIFTGNDYGIDNYATAGTNASIYWYGNAFIDHESNIEHFENDMTSGRMYSNHFVVFDGARDNVQSGQTPGGVTLDANYWSPSRPAAWEDAQDVTSGCTLTKTTGWRTLDDLGTPESDGRFSLAEALVIKAAIIAGARPASAANCDGTGTAIASRTFPSGITIEAGPANTDFDGNAYTSADIGPFAL